MDKKIWITAFVLGALAIVLGAFAAHGLKNKLDVSALQSFETGVKYQMYHALYVLFIAGCAPISAETKNQIMYLVIFGVVLFSGSIYLLSTQAITGIDFKKFGFITPIGGLLLIASWMLPLYKLVVGKL